MTEVSQLITSRGRISLGNGSPGPTPTWIWMLRPKCRDASSSRSRASMPWRSISLRPVTMESRCSRLRKRSRTRLAVASESTQKAVVTTSAGILLRAAQLSRTSSSSDSGKGFSAGNVEPGRVGQGGRLGGRGGTLKLGDSVEVLTGLRGGELPVMARLPAENQRHRSEKGRPRSVQWHIQISLDLVIFSTRANCGGFL